MAQFTQVVNQPFLYVNGLGLSYTSTTTLTIASGVCRDSTNSYDINLGGYFGSSPTSTVLNTAVKGVNGLDTGTLGASSWYAIYVIADPSNFNPPAVIASLSTTGPLMPVGTTAGVTGVNGSYSLFRRIGWALTDGSSHFLKFYQVGNGGSKNYQWDVPISVLSGGSATTFTAVSLAGAMPLQATPVYLNTSYTPAVANNTVNIRPTGSTAAAGSCPIILSGQVAAKILNNPMTKIAPLLATGNPSVDYIATSSDALTITVAGYDDLL